MFLEITETANTPLFIVAAITVVLMIIGMVFNKRIFNLLSIPGYIYLAIYYSSSIPLVLLFVGLIAWNIYYSFIADVYE